jgi:hypothetical protein
MYTGEPAGTPVREASWGSSFAVGAAALATILIGVLPSGTLAAASRAVAALGGH